MASSKVVGVKPTGSRVLIEMLTSQEILDTKIFVRETASNDGPPQAVVLAIGPTLVDHGLTLGDRVVLQGKYIPVPNCESDKIRGIVEYNDIKAILITE